MICPCPLPSYGIAVGSTSFSSNVAGVQHLKFHVKLTSFSSAVHRKRPATASLCPYHRYTCELNLKQAHLDVHFIKPA